MSFRGSLNAGGGIIHGHHHERHSRSGPNSQNNGNANNAIDSESEAPLDPFLMDFGASVNVHEDQIRHVRGCTQEIEERISKTNSDLKKEEMVNRQLKQDVVHCETEKRHILQVTSDQLETVQMQRNVLQGLENTLCANLVPGVVSPDRAPNSSHKAVNYGKDILPKRQLTFTTLSRQMKDDTRGIKDLHLQIEACQEKIRVMQERLDLENLQAVLLEKTQEADRMEKELGLEMEKTQITKAAVLKKRMEAGANAQELADLTKKRDMLRRETHEKKKEILEKMEKSKEVENQKRAENEDWKAQISKIQDQIQALLATERLQQALADAAIAIDTEQKRNIELTSIKEELAIKLEGTKKDLEDAESGLEQAKKLDGEARHAKLLNDEEYSMVLVPGRVELSEIAEKKGILAEQIKETQKSLSELEVTGKQELDSKLETKRLTLGELAALQELAENMKTKHETLETSNQQSKDSWEREIKELDELEKNLRNTTAAKEALMDQLLESQAKRRRESLDEARAIAESENAKSRRLLKLLGSAEKYIAKAKDKVRQLGENLDI